MKIGVIIKINLLLITFAVASSANAAECLDIFSKISIKSELETPEGENFTKRLNSLSWNKGFSRPKDGVAQDYVFLVTALDPARAIKHLSENNDFSQRPLIFGSVIADLPGKRKTVGAHGFILKVHSSNVIGTYPKDTGWYPRQRNIGPEAVAREVSQNYPPFEIGFWNRRVRPQNTIYDIGPVDPATLLKDTNNGVNEVLMVGTSSTGKIVEVAGVFQRTRSEPGQEQTPLNPTSRDGDFFKDLAEKLDLPFVYIPSF